MPFGTSDRRILEEIRTEVVGLRADLNLNKKLVDLLAEVKALREEQGGRLAEEAQAIADELAADNKKLDDAVQANQPT